MEVGAASGSEGVFLCEFSELSTLMLIVGGVEALETAKTVVGELRDEFLRAGPAKLILERMGEDRETACGLESVKDFLRRDEFSGAVVRAVRV